MLRREGKLCKAPTEYDIILNITHNAFWVRIPTTSQKSIKMNKTTYINPTTDIVTCNCHSMIASSYVCDRRYRCDCNCKIYHYCLDRKYGEYCADKKNY